MTKATRVTPEPVKPIMTFEYMALTLMAASVGTDTFFDGVGDNEAKLHAKNAIKLTRALLDELKKEGK